MKTIIRTSQQGDIVDIIASTKEESDRLKVWCYNNNPRCDNLNIWCNPIERGTWVKDDNGKHIFKFGSVEKDGRVYDYQGYLRKNIYDSLRPMYEDEIKEYLINEATGRGFCTYRRFKWNHGEGGTFTMILNKGFEYVPDCDALTVSVLESEAMNAVYMDGEWAELFYGKSLPTTTSALIDVLNNFCLHKKFYMYDDERQKVIRDFINKEGY